MNPTAPQTPGSTPVATVKPTAAPTAPTRPTPRPTPAPTPTPDPTPTPTPDPTPACHTVPNLIDMTFSAARTAWTDAGFTGAFNPATGQNKFKVATQDPTAGVCLPPTATMTVTR